MKISKALLFSITILLLSSSLSIAQSGNWKTYGDIRLAHIGADTKADGIGGPNSLLRVRPGLKYILNEEHSFSTRLVYLVSKELEPLEFTIQADGNRALAYGSLSFDEFYYKYKNSDLEFKIGRFQQSFSVLSNAKRSHFKFQSNANFVHWTDGIYFKRNLNDDWFGEAVIEYQHRDAVTFPYQANLTFGNQEHNLNYFLNLENQERDQNNIIQKGFGFLIAPNSYLKPDGYSTYAAFSSRIVFDIPKKDALRGGSIRIAGELGQNLNTEFKKGTSAVVSFGINNYAEKHELMVEFAKTDSQWLTASPYRANADELEIRYRYLISRKLNFDVRYRIRESRNDFNPTSYSTFFRATYSL